MSRVSVRRQQNEPTFTWIRRLIRYRLVQNVLTLSGVQIFTYMLPLVSLPFLVRMLGVEAWGRLAFYQAFAMFLGQFIEFGFKWSGTRDIAQHRKEPKELGRILAGVLGGKVLLSMAAMVVSAAAAIFVAPLGSDQLLLWLGLFWASGQGLNVIWFYHGIEQMRLASALTVTAKLIATIGVFAVVRKPQDAWMVLALQVAGAWLTAIIGLIAIHRKIPFVKPSLALSTRALRSSVTFFIFNSAVSVYTTANIFILGLFASPRIVAYYAGAEKISKAMLLLLTPLSRAIFPRVSYLVRTARDRAADLVRLEMKLLTAGAAVMAIGTIVFAPFIVKVVLGPGFDKAVPVLQIAGLLPLLIAPSIVLGAHWMMSLGLEKKYLRIVLMAGVINCSLAVLMARPFGAVGMMLAVVVTETFVIGSIFLWLWRQQLDPFRRPSPALAQLGVQS